MCGNQAAGQVRNVRHEPPNRPLLGLSWYSCFVLTFLFYLLLPFFPPPPTPPLCAWFCRLASSAPWACGRGRPPGVRRLALTDSWKPTVICRNFVGQLLRIPSLKIKLDKFQLTKLYYKQRVINTRKSSILHYVFYYIFYYPEAVYGYCVCRLEIRCEDTPLGISFQLCIWFPPVGSLNSATVGIVTPQKLADITNQALIYYFVDCPELKKLIVKCQWCRVDSRMHCVLCMRNSTKIWGITYSVFKHNYPFQQRSPHTTD